MSKKLWLFIFFSSVEKIRIFLTYKLYKSLQKMEKAKFQNSSLPKGDKVRAFVSL